MAREVQWDPLTADSGITLSNENRTVDVINTTFRGVKCTRNSPIEYGHKYYWELYCNNVTAAAGGAYLGVCTPDSSTTGALLGNTTTEVGYYNYTGAVYHDGSIVTTYNTWTTGDTVMVAYDPTAAAVWFGLNGVWNGDPAAGTGAAVSGLVGDYIPVVQPYNINAQLTANFDKGDLTYTPPTGFSYNAYDLSGRVLVNGTGASRVVRAYSYASGALVAMGESDSLGVYSLVSYDGDTAYIIHLEDNTKNYRSVVRDFITPEPQTP